MSKKFYIYCNDLAKSKALKTKLTKELKALGCVITPEADNIIVLGGDGTFVHAYNKYAKKNVKMALVNTGFVGFYAIDIPAKAKDIVAFYNNDKNFYTPDVVKASVDGKNYYGLNEIVLVAANTMSVDCYINNNFFQRTWGTGLCFATKTGSTGYNKSLNGSIMLTQAKLWQMCEMAPLAHAKYLSIRNSIVLDDAKEVKLDKFQVTGSVTLVNDGLDHTIEIKKPIVLSLTKLNAKIGFYKGLKSYLTKLQQVFLIGDKR